MYRVYSLFSLILVTACIIAAWHLINGFDPTQKRWWVWVVTYLKSQHSLPPQYLNALYVGLPFYLILPLLFYFMDNRAKNTTTGDIDTKNLHGSARWATKEDLKKAQLLQKTGVVVGGIQEDEKLVTPLRHNGPEHVLAFAPTRSGKGVGLVLPTILSWEHSLLVLDIKGENYALSAGWRAKQGQKILKFAPAELGATRFNPLSCIRVGTPKAISDCQNIAQMIIDPDGKGISGNYWREEGFGWLSVSLIHIVHYIHDVEKRTATFTDLLKFMSSFDDEIEEAADDKDNEDDKEEDPFKKKLNGILKQHPHKDRHVQEVVKNGFSYMMNMAANQRSGVHGTAKSPLSLYIDPVLAENVSTSDFTVTDLMNGETPASLYMVIPPTDLERLRPLFRIVLTVILNAQMEEMKFDGGTSVKGYKHRMLLMLDEFTSQGKLEIFQKSLAYMAGYGLKAYIIVQDLAQLQSAENGYGKDEAITSNCHVRIAYAPNKMDTAVYLSKMTGTTTITQHKKSRSAKHAQLMGGNMSESINEVSRPLLTPDECSRLQAAEKTADGKITKAGDMLTFVAGYPPYLGKQHLYFFSKDLLERAKIPAPAPLRRQDPLKP